MSSRKIQDTTSIFYSVSLKKIFQETTLFKYVSSYSKSSPSVEEGDFKNSWDFSHCILRVDGISQHLGMLAVHFLVFNIG